MSTMSSYLPAEIHELIVSNLTPSKDILRAAVSSPDPDTIFHRFQKSVESCAQLRFVSRRWNEIITPSIYELLVIPSRPSDICFLRVKAVEYHPELVETVILRSGVSGTTYYLLPEEDLRILEATMSKLTRLVRMEVWIGRSQFMMQAEMHVPRFFKAVTSCRLRAVVFYSMDLNLDLQELLALDPSIRDGLEELEFGDMYVIHHLMEPQLPFVLPSLERLTVRGVYGAESLHVGDFICQISRKPTRLHVEADLDDSSQDGIATQTQTRTAFPPLRHLVISNIYRFLNDRLFAHFLTSAPSYVGLSLTSLDIGIPASGTTLDSFTNTPYTIITCCPNLTRLMYFTLCPIPFLCALPERLQEFGVLIAHEIQVMMVLPSTALRSVEPLLEVLDTSRTSGYGGYRGNLKSLWVVWENATARDTTVGEELLREGCGRAGVEFFNELPVSLR